MSIIDDAREALAAKHRIYSPGEWKAIVAGLLDQWIPCSERLPEFDVRVLAAQWKIGTKRYRVAEDYRHEEYGPRFWGKCDGFHEVTHWQNLPAPPAAPEKDST